MFNKKMLTTLMVMTIALVAVSASAGDTEWNLYGKLHLSADVTNDGNQSQLGLSSNKSRFGVKGGSELNDNFTAIWQFESEIDLAAKGSETLATRNTFVGLKGNWGKLIAGIYDTPFKTLGSKVDWFRDEAGDLRQATFGWDMRWENVTMYVTPDLNGFGARLSYAHDMNELSMFENQQAATGFSGMAHYDKDAFFVGVAYETYSKGNIEMDSDADPQPESPNAMRAAASWTGEKFGVSALYQGITNNMGVKDWKSSTFGGSVKFMANEKWTFKANYYLVDLDTESLLDEAGEELDSKGSFMTFGVDHTFREDVKFYIQYAMASNNDVGYGVAGTDLELPDGSSYSWESGHGKKAHAFEGDNGPENPSIISIGMVKTF